MELGPVRKEVKSDHISIYYHSVRYAKVLSVLCFMLSVAHIAMHFLHMKQNNTAVLDYVFDLFVFRRKITK